MKGTVIKLSILIMVLGIIGFGCNKSSTVDSSLTEITVDASGLATAIDNKLKKAAEEHKNDAKNPTYEELKIVGYALLVAGYKDETLAFSCFVPNQKGDGNQSTDKECIPEVTQTTTAPSKVSAPNQPPETAQNPKTTKTSEPTAPVAPVEKNKAGKTTGTASTPQLELVKKEIKSNSKNTKLDGMKLKHYADYNYYGYLVLYCTTKAQPNMSACLVNSTKTPDSNKASYDSKSRQLNLPIELQWTQSFGGKEGVGEPADIKVTLEGTVSKTVNVKVEAKLEEETTPNKTEETPKAEESSTSEKTNEQ